MSATNVKEDMVKKNQNKHNYYQEFKERFKNMSDDQLIAAYNRERSNSGWVSAKATYMGLLYEEIANRTGYHPKLKAGDVFPFDKQIEILKDKKK